MSELVGVNGIQRNVLVVDDERTLRELLEETLTEAGFGVKTACCIEDGRIQMSDAEFDLVVLDVMMPEGSGFELLEWMRNDRRIETPVMLLTAVSAQEDKLRAFELNADDYIVKPFSLPEFVARVNAILRRSDSSSNDLITFGRFAFDCTARKFTEDGQEVKLRNKEYLVLKQLLKSPGKAISRQDLFHNNWGDDNPSSDKTVDVTIHTLRDKIEDDPQNPRWIITVRGFGYRFDPE